MPGDSAYLAELYSRLKEYLAGYRSILGHAGLTVSKWQPEYLEACMGAEREAWKKIEACLSVINSLLPANTSLSDEIRSEISATKDEMSIFEHRFSSEMAQLSDRLSRIRKDKCSYMGQQNSSEADNRYLNISL